LKTHYRKTYTRGSTEKFFYEVEYNYHRPIHTFSEVRQNMGVLADEELRELNVRPRACRNEMVLDSWNDFRISRNFKKSWKDFTKHRKQWMMGSEKPPQPCVWEQHPRWTKRSLRLYSGV
jgi:hypothetical protein